MLSSRLNFGFLLPPLSGKPPVIDDSDYIRVDGWNEGRGWQRPSQQWVSLYDLKGISELNFSLEYRFPISERIVWGLTFFDISGLYTTYKDFERDFMDFKELLQFRVRGQFFNSRFPCKVILNKKIQI